MQSSRVRSKFAHLNISFLIVSDFDSTLYQNEVKRLMISD